jgi:hypothetical protein
VKWHAYDHHVLHVPWYCTNHGAGVFQMSLTHRGQLTNPRIALSPELVSHLASFFSVTRERSRDHERERLCSSVCLVRATLGTLPFAPLFFALFPAVSIPSDPNQSVNRLRMTSHLINQSQRPLQVSPIPDARAPVPSLSCAARTSQTE